MNDEQVYASVNRAKWRAEISAIYKMSKMTIELTIILSEAWYQHKTWRVNTTLFIYLLNWEL